MNKWSFIKYFFALLIVGGLLLYLYTDGSLTQLTNVEAKDFLISILLFFGTYTLSGVQTKYLLKKIDNVTLSIPDTFFLPLSMNLFGYVIPANGGLLFSVLFLKSKYQLNLSKGFSIGVGLVLVTVCLSGIIGICLSAAGALPVIFSFFSMFFLLTPLLVWLLNKVLLHIKIKEQTWVGRVKIFLHSVIENSIALVSQTKIFSTLVSINLLSITMSIALYYWVNISLKTGLDFYTSAIIVLMLNISSLVRLVPGNLGIEEVVAGIIFGIAGKEPTTGALITLFIRAINLCVTIPGGIFHSTINWSYISAPLREWRKKTNA